MKRVILLILVLCLAWLWHRGAGSGPRQKPAAGWDGTATMVLVKEGRAASVVVLEADAPAWLVATVGEFVATVERSTGVGLSVVNQGEAATLPEETSRLYIGPSAEAAKEGLAIESLPEESYQIAIRPGKMFILGTPDRNPEIASNPRVVSRPTLWALNHLLEEGLGVRWLWPGKLGTYVPKQRDFVVAAVERSYQPKLLQRSLRLNISDRRPMASRNPQLDEKLKAEAILWVENHQGGGRGEVRFGHAFGDWWSRFSETHPDYFAELAPGYTQPLPLPGRVKLRLSNPAVIEQIAKDYEAAGKPKYWNVCPNDGGAFDVSEATRAWDIPLDQSIESIHTSKANLTARYVRFWNLLHERLREINPEVTLAGYAYSCYRDAPPPERPLKAKMVLQIVDSLDSFDNWRGWSAQGADLFLRPNWWHHGKDAPYLQLEKTTKFVKFAWENRMLGLDMDSILGFWATQGPNYYLVARLMTRPDLTKEQIIGEYLSAFGAAAPRISDYLDYWEKLAGQYNYVHRGEKGKSAFSELVKTGKIPSASVLNGSTYALPHLYNDEVLAPGLRLLDQAEALVSQNDPQAAQRVRFLRKGLMAMKATREQVTLGQELKKRPTAETLTRFREGWKQLAQTREELSAEHVVWGASERHYEERYRILIQPSALEFNEVNLDGL